MDILIQYWGLIICGLVFIGLYFYNKKQAIAIAKKLILEAEEKAEDYALKTGKDKFAWVSAIGYEYMPTSIKLFISQKAFDVIIQYVFDNLIDWAEHNKK